MCLINVLIVHVHVFQSSVPVDDQQRLYIKGNGVRNSSIAELKRLSEHPFSKYVPKCILFHINIYVHKMHFNALMGWKKLEKLLLEFA